MEPNVLVTINALDKTKEVFRQLSANVSKVADDVTIAKGKLEKLQPTFEKMATAGTVAFGAISLGVGRAMKSASDLEESLNAVQVVFGEGADEILRFGENAAKTVGISNAAFNQMSTQTGSLLRDTGLSMDEVADKTIELTKRAADMASVHNTSVADALSAINQALRGETEAIRRYSADVTDASIQSYLLSQGLDVSVASLSEQEKRLLRLEVVMRDTEVTAGDFTRTIGSTANQNRVLGASTEDASARLGKTLLPVLASVQRAFGPLLDAIASFIEKNPVLTRNIVIAAGALAGLTVAMGLLGVAVNILFSPVTAIIAAMGGVAAAVYLVAFRWKELPLLFKAVLLPVKMVVDGFMGLVNTLQNIGRAIGWLHGVITGTVGTAAVQTKATVLDLQATVNQFIDPLAGQSMQVDNFSSSLLGLGDDATDTADKLKKLKEEAAGIFTDASRDEADYKRQVAEAIIEQEQGISDKKRQLRELERSEDSDANERQIEELRTSIATETTALANMRDLRLQFSAEIEEAERRASLTAFERKIEDMQRERISRLEAHLARLQEIELEIAAERGKSNAIASAFNAAQTAMQSAITKTREVAEAEAERMKKAFDRAVSSMSTLSGGKVSTGSVAALLNRRAVGGPVMGSTPYIVGEQGPELFVPNQSGSIMNAGALGRMQPAGVAPIYITISNNSFMGERDMAEKVGDMIIRKLKNNSRL